MAVAIPRSVLFSCNLNSIRSPMAAGLAQQRLGPDVRVGSCGVYPGGYLDPFMTAAMADAGVSMEDHEPRTFEMVSEPYELVVALTPISRDAAEALAPSRGWRVEYWPSPDPSQGETPTRDARAQAYRDVRDQLDRMIYDRFIASESFGSTQQG